jgi:photosystem II stability/assembly factor-like uncharacterized protein
MPVAVHMTSLMRAIQTHRRVSILLAVTLCSATAAATAVAQPASVPSLPSEEQTSSAARFVIGREGNQAADYPQIVEASRKLLAKANATDCQLNAIAVTSPDQLCVVGDCGTILVSHNAGRSWSLIQSPTTAHLTDVLFLDSENGLAVGGTVGNYSGVSRAVILRTRDGGDSWETVQNDLPYLSGLALEANRILAWGHYDPQRRTSVFVSGDLGTTWVSSGLMMNHAHAVGATPDATTLGIDCLSRVCVADAKGRSFELARLALSGSAATTSEVQVRDVLYTGRNWIACGDQGLLKLSHDGQQWTDIELPLSEAARRLCHWQSISQLKNQIWISGSPGSILLHSDDSGESWSLRKTGFSLPIANVAFIDPQRGWAVGCLGRILATRDGGQSWYEQRNHGRRVGLLSIAERSEDIAWTPLLASAWESQISCVSLLTQPAPRRLRAAFLPDRAQQLSSLGRQLGIGAAHACCGALEVGESDASLMLASLLATWQPNVVLTSDRHVSLMLAARETVDGNAFPAALQEIGLKPCGVQKIASIAHGRRGQYSEQSQRVLQDIGLAVWDLLLLLPPEIQRSAEVVNMHTQWTKSKNRAATTSLLGAIPPDEATRRQLQLQTLGNYQLVMGRVHRQRSLKQLVENQSDFGQWKSDFEFIVRHLPEQEIEPAIWRLVESFRTPEQSRKREWSLLRLIQMRPGSDAATWAMLELLRSSGSEEIQAWHSAEMSQQLSAGQTASEGRDSNTAGEAGYLGQVPWNASPFSVNSSESKVIPAAAAQPVAVAAPATAVAAEEPTSDRWNFAGNQWFGLYSHFTQMEPRLLWRPDLQSMAQCMSRQSTEVPLSGQGHRLQHLLPARQLASWQQIALQELLLERSQLEQIKLLSRAYRTDERPLLNAKLDEPFWRVDTACQLSRIDDGRPASRVWFTYDEQYLYVAMHCPLGARHTPPPIPSHRSYDSDLSERDHVVLSFDSDRDYGATIQMAVAEDGQTYDRCYDHAEFNPKWHVAVAQGDDEWRAEVAIDLRYLTTQNKLEGRAWAITLQRVRSGQVIEAWGRSESGHASAEDAGLLIFAPPRITNEPQGISQLAPEAAH